MNAARHAQIGHPVVATVMKRDPEYVQYLVDKWLWRILTGLSTDYLTALDQRPYSFKEFMEEWIIDQFLRTLDEFGLKKPVVLGPSQGRTRHLLSHDLRERVQLPCHSMVQFCDIGSGREEAATPEIS
jgi:hypothetical protein